MKLRTWILAGAAVSIAALGAGAAERDLGTGYQLENVEVLDPGMGLREARRSMIEFNRALGVQCRDCHVLRDFPSDEKPLKLVAREMMKMTRDINERWFPDRDPPVVTCATCHQGRRVPAAEVLEDLLGLADEAVSEEDGIRGSGADPLRETETEAPASE
jgi:hypothetical protein